MDGGHESCEIRNTLLPRYHQLLFDVEKKKISFKKMKAFAAYIFNIHAHTYVNHQDFCVHCSNILLGSMGHNFLVVLE